MAIFVFRGGNSGNDFEDVFLTYFIIIDSKPDDVYVQNIRLPMADVLNICIVEF